MKKFLFLLFFSIPMLNWGQEDQKLIYKNRISFEYFDLIAGTISIDYAYFFNPKLGIELNPSFSFGSHAFTPYNVSGGGSDLSLLYNFMSEKRWSLYTLAGGGFFSYNINGYNRDYSHKEEKNEGFWVSSFEHGVPVLKYRYYDENFNQFSFIGAHLGGGIQLRMGKRLFLSTDLGIRYQHVLKNSEYDQGQMIGIHFNRKNFSPIFNCKFGMFF